MKIDLNNTVTAMHAVEPLRDISQAKTGVPERNGWTTLDKGVADLMNVGGEIRVSDEALDKNDALGQLVRQAYGL